MESENKYLEKIALNASKARALAKQVGIIPDHTSAWKYALRKLRGSRGEPLQGKALGEAKVKLGDVTNNSFQKVKAHTEHNGGSQGIEFGGKVTDGKIGKIRTGRYLSTPYVKGDNFHTHPEVLATIGKKDYTFLYSKPHRLARPSGGPKILEMHLKQ